MLAARAFAAATAQWHLQNGKARSMVQRVVRRAQEDASGPSEREDLTVPKVLDVLDWLDRAAVRTTCHARCARASRSPVSSQPSHHWLFWPPGVGGLVELGQAPPWPANAPHWTRWASTGDRRPGSHIGADLLLVACATARRARYCPDYSEYWVFRTLNSGFFGFMPAGPAGAFPSPTTVLAVRSHTAHPPSSIGHRWNFVGSSLR